VALFLLEIPLRRDRGNRGIEMEKPGTEEQMMELGQVWAAAELRGDANELGSLLADDFVCIGPLGFVLDKAQYLQSRRSGDLKHEAFAWEDLRVREFGETVVVVGTQTQRSTYQGRDASGRFRVTHVVVRRDDRWSIVHLHLSPIAPPPGSGRP
jgi:ketosteroid isomerase-like protein